MTSADLEKLRRIDSHLERLLAIASKRTGGEWYIRNQQREIGQSGDFETETWISSNSGDCVTNGWNLEEQDEGNFTFIASCAGNAEAGWKATRAAIACLLVICDPASGADFTNYGSETLLPQILAAFPNV